MAKQAPPKARLSLEPLNDRVVPSASIIGGDLTVYGSNAADDVTVSVEFVPDGSAGTVATGGGRFGRGVASEFGSYVVKVKEHETITQFPLSQVTGRVVFHGFGGDDRFHNTSGVPTHANGYEGSDILIGGWGNDVLIGGNGVDYMFGNSGNDEVSDQGTDFAPSHIEGGAGNDVLYGGYGIDWIYGGDGTDTLAGLDGDDFLYGENGTDYMFGHNGIDTMDAGTDTAWNYMEGGAGGDTMFGGNGWDYMYGQGGADTLFGRDGTDYLHGGDDHVHDALYGQGGNDFFQIDSPSSGSGNWDEARDKEPGDEYYHG